MNILMVVHFTQVPGEKGNGRFNYLANLLVDEGINVEVVTSDFSHRTKTSRIVSEEDLNRLKYKLTLINEPGYEDNISIFRLISHNKMSRNLKKYLKSIEKPDVIYCSVPSLGVAYVTSKYANMNKIKFVIDVQDLWPEAFKMMVGNTLISKTIFKPIDIIANRIYKAADEVIAVSDTYVDRVLSVNKKIHKGLGVYLGTDLETFDLYSELECKVEKKINEIWIVYIGTLGYSYDVCSVIDAINELDICIKSNLTFIVMGDGPLREKFENYGNIKGIKQNFLGRLEYSDMVAMLSKCDIAVNPIKSGSAASIINKVGDYAAAGLPVVNTQACKEYENIISEYKCGFNCTVDEDITITEAIRILIEDSELRGIMSKNSRIVAQVKFDRRATYKKILCKVLH